MAVTLHAKQEILLAGTRFTAQTNAIAEAMSTAELDATVYGNDTVIHAPGLKGYGVSLNGFWNPAEDKVIDDNWRGRNIPFSLLVTNGLAGTPARSFKSMWAKYELGGKIGELVKASLDMGAMDAPVYGSVLHNASATGNVTGTAFELGAIEATESLYGILHVFSGTGSFVVKIQSASDEAFTSPNDRITFATIATGTPTGSEWAKLGPGAITDTWWRAVATNPNTRDFAVIAAIQ